MKRLVKKAIDKDTIISNMEELAQLLREFHTKLRDDLTNDTRLAVINYSTVLDKCRKLFDDSKTSFYMFQSVARYIHSEVDRLNEFLTTTKQMNIDDIYRYIMNFELAAYDAEYIRDEIKKS